MNPEVRSAGTPLQDGSRPGDVYVNEPKPLQEGEEKHVLSVFVADEAGLINRVAGVFGRRGESPLYELGFFHTFDSRLNLIPLVLGANIESLAVGVTANKALFTIVVTGTKNTASNLVKQLSKLVRVKYVENITKAARVGKLTYLRGIMTP
jgi:acetolactate synthase-1/3 small subunit